MPCRLLCLLGLLLVPRRGGRLSALPRPGKIWPTVRRVQDARRAREPRGGGVVHVCSHVGERRCTRHTCVSSFAVCLSLCSDVEPAAGIMDSLSPAAITPLPERAGPGRARWQWRAGGARACNTRASGCPQDGAKRIVHGRAQGLCVLSKLSAGGAHGRLGKPPA